MKLGDIPIDNNLLIENQIFVELIIFLICRILELSFLKKTKKGDALGNLFGTLRRVFGIYFALYFWMYGWAWVNNIHVLSNMTELTGKTHFNIWLAWIVTIYVWVETCWAMFEIF